jgi:hypothetical protein
VTAILWILSLGAHLLFGALVSGRHGHASLGQATILLYLAVTYAMQRLARAGPLPQDVGSVPPRYDRPRVEPPACGVAPGWRRIGGRLCFPALPFGMIKG